MLTKEMVVKMNEDLAEAKAKAAELQRQLNESKKGCASGCLGMLIAIVSVIGVACWGVMMIFK